MKKAMYHGPKEALAWAESNGQGHLRTDPDGWAEAARLAEAATKERFTPGEMERITNNMGVVPVPPPLAGDIKPSLKGGRLYNRLVAGMKKL